MSEHRTTSQLITAAEATVGEVLQAEVIEHMALARDLTDATGDLIERIQGTPGDPRAIHACAFLLARLVTDLQGVVHLVRYGYVAPALSLTAGMLEMAHVSMYIGADEDRAEKWLSHADTKTAAPWGTFDTVQGVAKSVGVPDETMRREWDTIYRTACMAKHGNPLALKQVGYVERGGDRFILAGPYLSRDVRAWARMSLVYAIRYTKLAALKFISDHVPASRERDEMYAAWIDFGDRQQKLSAADIAEFGRPA